MNMARFYFRISLLCCLAVLAWSDRDENFCQIVSESYGLVPPPLPTNFIMMQEKIIPLTKTLKFESFYFDNINDRAKYVSVTAGIETHYIFDYDTQQIIIYFSIHPGVSNKNDPFDTCMAQHMGDSNLRHVFGYRDGEFVMKRSKMFNSNEMLRFGGKYLYAANGTEIFESRGFAANKFVGCIYDELADATMNITYYFSNDIMMPAGGTDGKNAQDKNFLSIPLAAKYNGTVPNSNETIPPYTFDIQANIPWFIGEPEFDYDTFQIPQWMYCEGLIGLKKMNQLPDQFSTRMEITGFAEDQFGRMTTAEMLSYEQIFYDKKKGLARRDYTPSKENDEEIFINFRNYGRVKEIFDYNVGVAYIIHISTGRCYARDIKRSDYFETLKEQMYDMIATPEELFLIDKEKQEYKGKYFARDIETDVWAGKTYDEIMNVTFYRETYISTDGWHEEANEKSGYSIPVRQTIITDVITEDELTRTVREKNFFKFKAAPPPLILFNTDGCSETLDHKILFIPLSIAPKDESYINGNKWYFYQAAQEYLAGISEIGTPLRIQKVQLLKTDDQYFLSFAFIVKATATERGLNVDDAILNLKKYIAENRFQLEFKVPGTTESKIVTAETVIVAYGSGRTEAAVPVDWKLVALPKKQFYAYLRDEPKDKVEVKKGMSPGGLAGLSIAMLLIGIAVGIALMYLYIRKYDNQGNQQFPMKG